MAPKIKVQETDSVSLNRALLKICHKHSEDDLQIDPKYIQVLSSCKHV